MFQNNLLMASASAAGGQFTVTAEELQPYFTHTGGTSQTYSDVDLGDDTSDAKHVILALGWGSDATAFSSCTIAGVTATNLVTTASPFPYKRTIILIAQTTATTGDIVFTQASGSFAETVFQTFQMVNGSATPIGTISNNANPATGTIDIVAGGFCVGVMEANTSATMSWTGLTERYDRGSNAAYGIAYDMDMSAETGRTVTATPSGSPTQRALSVASFGPAS